MADNEDMNETAPKGNEWEVLSLTASAYSAAPGPKQVDLSEDSRGSSDKETEAEISRAMFMSGHFVFPPSQHENLPLESQPNEIRNEKSDEGNLPHLIAEESGKSDLKGEEQVNIEELISDEYPGDQVFDDSAFDKERFISGTAEHSAFQSVSTMSMSSTVEEDAMTGDMAEPFEHTLASSMPNFQNPIEEDKYDGANLPCEAWWKRRALSLYAHAKEANTIWSVLVAAAVTGLLLIGHKWQQERWQVLQLKHQFSINEEKIGRILDPITRFKDVIFAGHQRRSFLRVSNSARH